MGDQSLLPFVKKSHDILSIDKRLFVIGVPLPFQHLYSFNHPLTQTIELLRSGKL